MKRKRNARISTLGSRITAIISVSLVLLVLGIVAMTGITARSLSDDIRRNAGFIIKMDYDVTEARLATVRGDLGNAVFAESYTYSSAEDILARESEALGQDVSELLDSNPYAAEFDVTLSPAYAYGDSLERLIPEIRSWEGVQDVLTDTDILNGINATLERITIILLVVAAALLLISCVLISNTVSLSVYSRRFLIHTMRLVGATAGFIRRPFIIAGMVSGLIAGVIASGAVCAIKAYLVSLDSMVDSALPWIMMLPLCGAIILTGIIICALAATVATTRYLRKSYDEMFLN